MPRIPAAALLLLAAALAPAGAGAEEPAPARGPAEVVPLRFGWPTPARARVTYRRTRIRAGGRPSTFTARYETAVAAGEGGLRVTVRGTTWRGDLPFPAALAKDAIRATEEVVQRIRPQGEFAGLEGAEALRPVLARVLDDARIPPEQAERALALALAATRAEAEEVWNLAVGFWSGADLRLGETYVQQVEAALPLLSGVRVPQAVEFGVRRHVPCAAAERAARCVEVVHRSTPDRAALERAAPALLARLRPGTPARRDGDGEGEQAPPPPGPAAGLAAERTLLLVTDPATLLPRRVVWTKAVRLGGDGRGPPEAEEIDRSEWDYRWLPPAPPARSPLPSPLPSPASRGSGDPGTSPASRGSGAPATRRAPPPPALSPRAPPA